MSIMLTKSRQILPEYLVDLPDPQPLGRFHRPLRFDFIYEALVEVFKPEKVTLGINSKNTKLFGLLEGPNINIGFRSSSDESMALRIAAGKRVRICDNMLLSGNAWIINKHHTTHFCLRTTLFENLPKLLETYQKFESALESLKYYSLTDERASQIIVHAIRLGAFPANDCKKVADLYWARDESPESEGFGGTKWSLLQAFTRVAKDHPIQTRFARTMALGRLFGV